MIEKLQGIPTDTWWVERNAVSGESGATGVFHYTGEGTVESASCYGTFYAAPPPGSWEASPATFPDNWVRVAVPAAATESIAVRELETIRQDIRRANEILNDAAADADLCSSYERALERVNHAVSSFKLVGRHRDQRVFFTITVPDDFDWSDLERSIDTYLGDHGLERCTSFDHDECDG